MLFLEESMQSIYKWEDNEHLYTYVYICRYMDIGKYPTLLL